MNIYYTTANDFIDEFMRSSQNKDLETMKSITAGQNNKVVYMPYEATGILSSVDGIKQMLDSANK